ncbi:MAG: hypothetical protein R3Y17_01950 [Rikenellaceae bacterium]
MEQNRRLVIPQLGAFLVKEPNRALIFSPLLTKDDGLLHSLLLQAGVSEVEASGMIQRLVFDVRFLQENGGELTLEGIGNFRAEAGGPLKFEAIVEQTPPEQVETEPIVDLEPDEASAQESAEQSQTAQSNSNREPEQVQKEPETRTPTPLEPYSRFEPDPDLEGLSYGSSSRGSRRSHRNSTGRKRVDWWLIIGIAAVALALGSILYGFLREGARNDSPASYSQQGW